MIYKDNPSYVAVGTSKVTDLVFYQMKDITALSMDRRIALEAQMTFADGIVTRDILKEIAQSAIKDLNDTKSITNQAVYWNNILYRCSYPVDEDVALRAAATTLFVDGEDPDKVEPRWTDRKVAEIKADNDLYAFFLTMGINLIPAYKPYLKEISLSYFQRRKQSLLALSPLPSE